MLRAAEAGHRLGRALDIWVLQALFLQRKSFTDSGIPVCGKQDTMSSREPFSFVQKIKPVSH